MGKEKSVQQMVSDNWIHMQKDEVGPLLHTKYKNWHKMDRRPKCKS